MYEVEMQEMSAEFLPCWKAAGKHLDRQVDVGIHDSCRAHPHPPFLDHLSFRLGNQLFFVRVEDIEGEFTGPGSLDGLKHIAKTANGRACILPMKKGLSGQWVAVHSGWGLVDALTDLPINPAALVSDRDRDDAVGDS